VARRIPALSANSAVAKVRCDVVLCSDMAWHDIPPYDTLWFDRTQCAIGRVCRAVPNLRNQDGDP